MAVLSAVNLKKNYGDVNVIPNLNLDVEEGDFTVLVGPSGCGKSTLLRMMAGLEDVTNGELQIDGRRANDLHPRERGVSMVFQSYALYPHMTVADNIGFGLKLEGRKKSEIKQAVHEVADTLQLGELLERKPGQLSGGQRQRVAIGRAIVRKPRIILFDEPLSNLDAKLRVEMRMELMKFHRNHNITTIYVTHDQVEAMTMADKIAVMEKGHIQQFDTPKNLFSAPANPFVAGFIGSPQMNLFDIMKVTDASLQTSGNAEIKINPSAASHFSDIAALGVRPEHLSIHEQSDNLSIEAEVDLIESLGDESIIHFVSGNERITGRFYTEINCQIGQKLFLSFDMEHVHLFDEKNNRVS
ncbi:ABC transporter ATP-binding protein [Lentilitoribacter sp. EG35]|uniref:ABC transporter ATP-binding protein n=1 Tax=Lentilitoribacter sp. EG35 TaxID=3234192 RepID=UPI00345F5A4F